MNGSIRELLDKIAGSEELQAKFADVTTPEEAYELAKTIQDGFTKEEFLEAAAALAGGSGDISDETLAAAAGGTDAPGGTLKSIIHNPLSAVTKASLNYITAGGPHIDPPDTGLPPHMAVSVRVAEKVKPQD